MLDVGGGRAVWASAALNEWHDTKIITGGGAGWGRGMSAGSRGCPM